MLMCLRLSTVTWHRLKVRVLHGGCEKQAETINPEGCLLDRFHILKQANQASEPELEVITRIRERSLTNLIMDSWRRHQVVESRMARMNSAVCF